MNTRKKLLVAFRVSITMQVSKSVYSLSSVTKNVVRHVSSRTTTVGIAEDNVQELKSIDQIPGPPSLPIIGQLHNFLPGGLLYNLKGTFLSDKLYNTYGPIVRFDKMFGRYGIIFLFDPETSAQILRGENWLPARPGFESLEYFRKEYKRDKSTVGSTGLLTEHDETWKEFRSKVSPVLMMPKTMKLYTAAIDKVATEMIDRIKKIRDNNNMIQKTFDKEMNLWALESIGVVALGSRLNCFDPNLAPDSPVQRLIKNVHELFEIVEKVDFEPSIWRYYPTKMFKKAMAVYSEQESLAKYFVNKAVADLKTNKKESEDVKGVLEKLLEIDENTAITMACDMMLAGVDTVAHSMLGILYQLAANTDKQNKLREEVMSDQPKRSYLKACIKEGIRMMPVVIGNFRRINKEYDILGYKLPKGTHVSFMHHHLCMMDSHFPRAKEYIPERWTADKQDRLYYGNTHPFVYSPFGFGVRSCIGRRIADLEMEVFLEKVIKNFEVEWVGPPPTIKATTLNYVEEPFNYIFKDLKK